jgi:hypothetical protein
MEGNYAVHRKAYRRGEYRKLAIVGAVIVAFLAIIIAAASSSSGPRPARAAPPPGYRSGR